MPMRPPVCQWLVSINAIHQATEQITGHIEALRTGGLLGPRVAEIHKLAAEELSTTVRCSAIMNVMGREQRTAGKIAKKRRALENRAARE